MRTNIVIDQTLISEAFSLTGLKTKRELVHLALQELVCQKKMTQKRPISEAFAELRRLKITDDPFPIIKRQNRPNPFADEL